MKAYVINQGQLKQYIMIAVAALVLSFLFGYIVGDSKNEAVQVASGKTIDATAAPSLLAMETDDKTLIKKNEKEAAQKNLKKIQLENKKDVTNKAIQKNKVVVKKVVSNKQDSKPATVKNKKPVILEKSVEREKKSTREAASTKPRSSDTLVQNIDNQRLYSIQAGMFASRNNADSFIEKLAVENFEAYVSDFVSTSGAVKYNVRVGRFDERDKAREKLKEYQKFFSTPAYVVISQ